jgi:hypothetical protein
VPSYSRIQLKHNRPRHYCSRLQRQPFGLHSHGKVLLRAQKLCNAQFQTSKGTGTASCRHGMMGRKQEAPTYDDSLPNACTRNCPIRGEGDEAAGHASRAKLTKLFDRQHTLLSLSTVIVGYWDALPTYRPHLVRFTSTNTNSACGTKWGRGREDIPCHRPHTLHPAQLGYHMDRVVGDRHQ